MKNFYVSSKNVLLKESGKFKTFPAIIEISENHITNLSKFNEIKDYEYRVKNTQSLQNIKIQDFGDRLITPAFVNAHTHLAMNAFKRIKITQKSNDMIKDIFFKVENLMSAEDIKAFSKIGIYENVLNGIGLVWDHYYYGLEVAEACLDLEFSAVISPTLQDISGPGVKQLSSALKDTFIINEKDIYKKNGIFSALGPHATETVSDNLWKEISILSEKSKIPIHFHCAQTEEEQKIIFDKYNKTPYEFLESLGVFEKSYSLLFAHNILIKESDFKLIPKEKSTFVFCPFSQMIFLYPADVRYWDKNKISWIIATDCVASNDSMNLQKELKLVSGMSSFEKTFNKNINSKFLTNFNTYEKDQLLSKIMDLPGSLHSKFTVGKIAKGALANLVIWNTNHPAFWPENNVVKSLVLGDTLGAIENVMVNGNWFGESGNFVQSILESEQYKESLREAEKRLGYLLKRIKN